MSVLDPERVKRIVEAFERGEPVKNIASDEGIAPTTVWKCIYRKQLIPMTSGYEYIRRT